MFYECSNLEYINLRKSNIPSNANRYNIFSLTPQNLMLCTENENEILINLFGEKMIMYCDDNHKVKYNCYMKNLSLYNSYICDICQNDFLFNYSELNNNYSYINCFEPKVVVCYNSCKTCEIEGNETNNNCIECKDDFIYELNITNTKYKNCYIDNPFKPSTTIVNIVYTSELDSTNVNDITNYTNNTNFQNYTNYINFTHYTNFTDYIDFTNYTNYTNYSNYINFIHHTEFTNYRILKKEIILF